MGDGLGGIGAHGIGEAKPHGFVAPRRYNTSVSSPFTSAPHQAAEPSRSLSELPSPGSFLDATRGLHGSEPLFRARDNRPRIRMPACRRERRRAREHAVGNVGAIDKLRFAEGERAVLSNTTVSISAMRSSLVRRLTTMPRLKSRFAAAICTAAPRARARTDR
ncbi:MAG: hypothetical protein R3D01_04465 [Hyphomicrobiales bacterium]